MRHASAAPAIGRVASDHRSYFGSKHCRVQFRNGRQRTFHRLERCSFAALLRRRRQQRVNLVQLRNPSRDLRIRHALEHATDFGASPGRVLVQRIRVHETGTLPYQTQLIPLSVICSKLGEEFEKAAVHAKIARWYWCGVFGELYGGANEGRYAFDVPDVLGWIAGGPEPRTVKEATFAPMRLLSLQTRLSAAYKGVMALLLELGAHDFRNGDRLDVTNYYDVAVDIHHIFPQAHCEKMGYERSRWNSVINKSPITAKANRIIGGHKPSTYLARLEREGSVDAHALDEILPTHAIAPELLRADDFDGFIRSRAIRLLDLIEKAMGKPIEGRDSDEVCLAFGGSLARGLDVTAPGITKPSVIPPEADA